MILKTYLLEQSYCIKKQQNYRMKTLKKHPHLTIKEVADLTGESRKQLRDEQLMFIKKHVRRNSEKWNKF